MQRSDPKTLIRQYREGSPTALDQLIREQKGLVLHMCKIVRGVEATDEAISEGMYGLFEAARRFDPNRGAWSTYACVWIRKYLLQHRDARRDVATSAPEQVAEHTPLSVLEQGGSAAQESAESEELFRRLASLPERLEPWARIKWRIHGRGVQFRQPGPPDVKRALRVSKIGHG